MGDRQIHHAERELGYRNYLVSIGKGIRIKSYGMGENGGGADREERESGERQTLTLPKDGQRERDGEEAGEPLV